MTAPRFRSASPVLLVADAVKAAAYYTEKLGFSTASLWGEPPTFAVVVREGFEVLLNQVGPGDSFRPNGDYGGRYDVYFYVADVDALFAEYAATGANIICEPDDQIYGMREFSVLDADGHLLAFGEEIRE